MKLLMGLLALAALLLDSPTATEAALNSLKLCGNTLIPGLFPLFVLTALLVPQLGSARVPGLPRLLGIPQGSEGLYLLGCAGGFPVGAACVAQAVREGGLRKLDAERMLGLCSFCGPSFLFGVLGNLLGWRRSMVLFCIQLETSILLAALWPHRSTGTYHPTAAEISLPEAVRSAIRSMLSVCGWVMLAGTLSGLAQKWVFPRLPDFLRILLTGLLELTGGMFATQGQSADVQFLLCAIFATFGGISVLLQIAGLAAGTGLSMQGCLLQKTLQSVLSAILAVLWLRFGCLPLILTAAVPIWKIAVEIPGRMVYNVGRKEGI